jgi:hypothetical protein
MVGRYDDLVDRPKHDTFFGSQPVEIPMKRITGLDRFSIRA